MKSSLGYTVTYKKTWLGKQLGIENVYGDWEESYQKIVLRSWVYMENKDPTCL